MGQTECSVEKNTSCLKDGVTSPDALLHEALGRYATAQEDTVHNHLLSTKAPPSRPADSDLLIALPVEGASRKSTASPALSLEQLEQPGQRRLPDREAEGLLWLRNLYGEDDDSVALPLQGEDEACDMKIWTLLPDPQTGSAAGNQRATARAIKASADTIAIGPGRSAAKEHAKEVRKEVEVKPSEELPHVPRDMCYFDMDIGEKINVMGDQTTYCKHTFRSGATYEGEWLDGFRSGLGKQMWLDGTEYIGQWKNGRAMGMGTITHSNGDTYCGEWVNGRAQGYGVYRTHGGQAVYEGEFKCDARDGNGIELWVVDGSYYAGQFVNGAKHGLGEHVWPDSTQYVGSWKANELCGPGRYCLKDGGSYDGQWDKNIIHGLGSYRWASGQLYMGYYQKDIKHGFGVLVSPAGVRQEGFWQDGKLVKARRKRFGG